jgi:uncharacterized cupin superfamily protein
MDEDAFGSTFAVDVLSLELEPEELDPSQVVAGAPALGNRTLFESDDGRVIRGVWECTPGISTDVEQDELFVVVAGRASVAVEGGPTLLLAPGVVGILERGAKTVWTVTETLRKVYQISMPD